METKPAVTATSVPLTPDILTKLDGQVTSLDPRKIHLITVDAKAPDEYVRHLQKELSVAGIFAIILTDLKVKVYSTFPVEVAIPQIDVAGTAHDPAQFTPPAAGEVADLTEKPAKKKAAPRKKAASKKKAKVE